METIKHAWGTHGGDQAPLPMDPDVRLVQQKIQRQALGWHDFIQEQGQKILEDGFIQGSTTDGLPTPWWF